MTQITGHQLIGFSTSAQGTETFQAANPAQASKLEVNFHEATSNEVHEAVEKAQAAFQLFKKVSNARKAQLLIDIADEILALGDTLIERCMAETALPRPRLEGERGRTMNQLKLFAEVVKEGSWVDARIDTAIPDRQPLPKPDIRQMQVALGPVGVFGASNFPLAFSVAGGDTASALAAGCPVVVKGHPLHPGTSELVGHAINKAIQKNGLPEGIFSLVQGTGIEVGMTLVQHPGITAIGFTGSYRGGKALFDAANQRAVPIPVYAEMGSTNPVFMLPGALEAKTEELAKGLAGSFTLGVGQFCTNPGMVILPEHESATTFKNILNQANQESAGGTMLSAGIKSAFEHGVSQLKENGAVSSIGSSPNTAEGNQVQSHIFETSLEEVIKDSSLQHEVFGPSTLLVNSSGKEDILNFARNLEGHLTATLFGTEADLAEYAELIDILEQKVGRIIFNSFPTGVEVCHSMVHGGPFPATTAPQTTSVGTAAIKRFARPVCYQGFPQSALPEALKDENPLGIWRLVDGELKK
ncbi:aldehyde dehydrogenase (NADP(+)) [Roseivirga sp.]|uniref:aldehyde dehydrogenase (NADP(+)) n=1 Tax=Roseivirga sp. TaxID=1964215 RepID=UPI003B52D76E